jgi:hypothetical protein
MEKVWVKFRRIATRANRGFALHATVRETKSRHVRLIF